MELKPYQAVLGLSIVSEFVDETKAHDQFHLPKPQIILTK